MPSIPTHEESSPRFTLFAAIGISVMLLPWLSVLACHYLGNGASATGFIQYDQPYYVANGRAAFERGNGWMYPNPSDASADAPAIYFHWMPWILGLGVTRFGLNPGTAYSLLNASLLPVFGLLTWQLVRHRSTAHRPTLMLLALWGGGILSLMGLLKGLATGVHWDPAVFEFDPIDGYWFLNWGRNTVYGCEITYHCLVAAAWLAVLRERPGLALLFAGLLGLTHPWSGLETLLVLNAWYLLQAIRHRRGNDLRLLGAAVALLTFLLGYYKIWLPSFPAHAALQENWSLNWRVESSTALYAWGPVGLLAVVHLIRSQWKIGRGEQFLLVAAAVAFGLSMHDRFLPKSVQPIHFTRGYIWMPLFLVSVPSLQELLATVNRLSLSRRSLIIAGLLIVMCFDNVAFTVAHGIRQYRAHNGFVLTPDDRRALDVLAHDAEDTVVFCESLELSYLMPTYVPVRPWLCHKFNTPDYIDRQKALRDVIADNRIVPNRLPDAIDVLVLRADRNTSSLKTSRNWLRTAGHNGSWQIWMRTGDAHSKPVAERVTTISR